MKTAKEYLYAVMGCEPVNSRIDYTDALEAVQAALDDAASVRQQVAQGIADYFGDIMPLPPLPELPVDAPPIRLGQKPAPQVNVFPPACPRCTQRLDQCLCPQMFPNEPLPPF